ncbi:MAG: type 1 glutamine amidotransferase [Deltaproteobacteria bacterium]
MLYIIQNDPEVPPGNIEDFLPIPYVISHPYNGEPLPIIEHISALIVLGGAMGANDDERHPFLTGLKCLIRDIISARLPFLGICLGGQLLAAAIGSRVVANRWGETGTMKVCLTEDGKADPLFRGIPPEFMTFQWHNDSFDLPAESVLLAYSSTCQNQAFRVGDSAWGLQFHPEVTERIIRDWCAWDSSRSLTTEQIVGGFKAEAENCHTASKRLIRNFLTSISLLP